MVKDNRINHALAPRSPKGEANRTESDMHYGAESITFKNAKYLRDNETQTEKLLWQRLRTNQTGVKFRRQHPIGKYIADFYCHSIKLIIELDGKYHHTRKQLELDKHRDNAMEELGIQILRFSDDDVLNDIDSVVTKIKSIALRGGSPLGDKGVA